jgi:undecaprenyl diphosphate synthase
VLSNEVDTIVKEGVRLRFIGERSRFGEQLVRLMGEAEARTAAGTGPTLAIAVSYGGRQELVDAVRKLIASHARPETIDEAAFAAALYAPDMPDVDLVIRTSGELRTSNFLPWQTVYAEWFFPETMWPAFSKEEFDRILNEYSERDRRRGK